MNNKNIYFVNVAKTLAIFLVALTHLSISHGFYSLLNSFSIPLFFFISGYLLTTKSISLKKFVHKKFRSLIVPYFVFAVMTLLFWYFAGRKLGNDTQIEQSAIKFIYGIFLAIPSKDYLGFNMPLWFLPALFCSEILFFQIQKFNKAFAWIAVAICFLAGVLLAENNLGSLPYGLSACLFALPFLKIGYFFKEKNIVEKLEKLSNSIKIIIALILLVVCVFFSIQNDSVGFYACYFNNYFLFLAAAFSGIFSIILLSLCAPKLQIINFFGRNTIIIMAFHLIGFSLIKGFQVFIFKIPISTTEDILWINILYVFLTFALLYPFIQAINKYCPALLGREKNKV
jgi:fucose 4-O-acetylase-like acetyltransferase